MTQAPSGLSGTAHSAAVSYSSLPLAPFGNKGVTGENEAGGTVRVFADTDPGRHQDFTRHKSVIPDLQFRFGRGKIGAVVTLPRHPESLA